MRLTFSSCSHPVQTGQFLKTALGAREMALWIKYFAYRAGELELERSQNPYLKKKPGATAHACNPRHNWESRGRSILGALDQLVWLSL